MSLHEIPLTTLDGTPTTLGAYRDQVVLIVNVASRCGLTPQYEGLQKLHDSYAANGFSVLGFPCNQFLGQEPGDADEIQSFCSTSYGVTFPLFEKIEVNGPNRHPLYAALTDYPDIEGKAGDIAWNFEKFLVDGDGNVVGRFRPLVEPLDPLLVAAVETRLPTGR